MCCLEVLANLKPDLQNNQFILHVCVLFQGSLDWRVSRALREYKGLLVIWASRERKATSDLLVPEVFSHFRARHRQLWLCQIFLANLTQRWREWSSAAVPLLGTAEWSNSSKSNPECSVQRRDVLSFFLCFGLTWTRIKSAIGQYEGE